MSIFTTSTQHSIGSPSHSNQIRNRSKRHPNLKRGSKTVIVCRWHDNNIENPTDSTKKLLNLINEFGKTAGYKLNIQKSKTFLYTNNEISETEIREKIPFDIATRKIKYLGIHLTKEVKDLYSENYTTLKEAILKNLSKVSL